MPTVGSILGLCNNSCTYRSPIHLRNYCNEQFDFRTSSIFVSRPRNPAIFNGFVGVLSVINGSSIKQQSLKSVTDENQDVILDEEEEEDLCPVECVREFYTDEEFLRILEKAKKKSTLVVVDFYRTSCGSCKYIEQGFSKLCKASGDDDVPVIFLKHNVLDEYDEQSEVAERLRIKTVPLFHFYKNGVLLEAFPTRDKERITEAIYKYSSSPAPQESTN
ncbi:thioredoxin-like 4, chloroplastic [Chenopodium quinoa]|uniref:thioredoxin-like 4, chloroplastic n=1 Tax=Chenopodium quinoa TaxID=63459 RepID=UPI000B79AC57|nr:thioredoxin-like 4, chloroplastic [Chenopodium quinoa]